MATTIDAPHTPLVEQRTIALSRIVIADGLNPRGAVVDDAELDALAESMRQVGCLQPIRVRPDGTGGYLLIAGERRYRAAIKAALTELPAIVRPAGAGDESEENELLAEAVIENDLRDDLTPRARARAYAAMRAQLTVRGIAERLSTTQARVREHLAILTLPDSLQEQVDRGEIPLGAIKTLTQLTKIHPDLAELAARTVLQPPEDEEPVTWQELTGEPFECILHGDPQLPAGVYRPFQRYALDCFTLSEKATKDLAAYNKLATQPLQDVQFNQDLVAQAEALGAAHGAHWYRLIAGQDVADQLAGDHIATLLRRAREDRKRQKAIQDRQGAQAGSDNSDDRDAHDADAATDAPPGPQELAEQAAAERAAAAARKQAATAYNIELGVLIVKHLARVKVDERVLRILSAIDVGGTIKGLANRGARYGLPGWVQETSTRAGKTKTTYLEPADAERRATKFLEGASSLADIAGRQVVLIAMAALADEDAVANSNRSFHQLAWHGPWARQAEVDLEEIVRERIPEGRLPTLDHGLQQRAARRAERAQEERERAEKARIVEERLTALTDLTDDELHQLVEDAGVAYGPYATQRWDVQRAVEVERARRAESPTA